MLTANNVFTGQNDFEEVTNFYGGATVVADGDDKFLRCVNRDASDENTLAISCKGIELGVGASKDRVYATDGSIVSLSEHLGEYLPLAGGTMTGDVEVPTDWKLVSNGRDIIQTSDNIVYFNYYTGSKTVNVVYTGSGHYFSIGGLNKFYISDTAVNVMDNLSVGNTSSFTGAATFSNNVTVDGSITVSGDTTFGSTVKFEDTTEFSDTATFQTATFIDAVIFRSTTAFSGTSTFSNTALFKGAVNMQHGSYITDAKMLTWFSTLFTNNLEVTCLRAHILDLDQTSYIAQVRFTVQKSGITNVQIYEGGSSSPVTSVVANASGVCAFVVSVPYYYGSTARVNIKNKYILTGS